jgi:mRNA interferase MazF
MRRGEIWTLRDDEYASKARPVVIVQGDLGEVFDSVILCLFTTFVSNDIKTRVKVEPIDENGLRHVSYVMTDKIVSVARGELGKRMGILTDDQMHAISRQLAKLLVITEDDIG